MLITLAKYALGVCVATTIGLAFWRQREGATLLLDGSWEYVLISLGVLFAYRLLNSLGWWGVLKSIGVSVPPSGVSRVWLVSEATRWLPGGVWNLVSRATMAAEIGVAPSKASVSITLEMLLTLGAWSLASLTLLLHHEALTLAIESTSRTSAWLLATLFLLIALVCLGAKMNLHLFIASRCARIWSGIRTIHNFRPNPQIAAITTAYYVCLCLLQGIGLWALFRGCCESVPPLTLVIGANALAWIVGFLAIFSPGGLVVREGVLVMLLAGAAPAQQVAAIAIAWRLLQIVAEVGCLAFASTALKNTRVDLLTAKPDAPG